MTNGTPKDVAQQFSAGVKVCDLRPEAITKRVKTIKAGNIKFA